MLQKQAKTITPRGLVMSLFNAPDTGSLTIGQLIAAGALFNIETTTVRMAVTRLIKDGLIASEKRGVYRAGSKALSLSTEIQSWRRADQKIAPWNGDWCIALTSHLGRTNKTQLRSMQRAFQLYGLIEFEVGVWVRPANLVQDIDQLKVNLIEIGMDAKAYVINVNKVAGGRQEAWHSLWPTAELEAAYTAMIDTLRSSLNRLQHMSCDEAARESLVVGESAIRLINLDPLLPKELINTELFKRVVAEMVTYDNAGQKYWQQFFSS